MLSSFSEDAANCYRRAAECQELARLATNEKDRDFYLDRERGWLLLARSHQLTERANLMLDDLDRRRSVIVTRVCPNCGKTTLVHYDSLFVCTNCKLVFEDQ
jgi:ribosomal protein S27AE